jgi:hypothetical protein
VHKKADALHQLGWSKPLFDQHELHTGVQSLAVFCVEIEGGDDDNWNVPQASFLLQGGNDLEAIHLEAPGRIPQGVRDPSG